MLAASLLFARKVSLARILIVIVVCVAGLAIRAGARPSETPKPKVSDQPFTAEQLAIYRLILTGWMSGGPDPLNLVVQTDAFPMDGAWDAHDCLKGLDVEPNDPLVVHRFAPEDLAQLSPARVRLVERDAQEKDEKANDPWKSFQRGKPLKDALKNGFAHGFAWFSEIRFDKSHSHAVVFYGFICGDLCGNGGTAILEKTKDVWKVKSQCSEWES